MSRSGLDDRASSAAINGRSDHLDPARTSRPKRRPCGDVGDKGSHLAQDKHEEPQGGDHREEHPGPHQSRRLDLQCPAGVNDRSPAGSGPMNGEPDWKLETIATLLRIALTP